MVLALALLAPALLGAEPAKEAWDCLGKLTPPLGYRQQTAFVPLQGNPNASQAAMERATEQLVRSLCDRDCGELLSHIVPWKTGLGAGQACAMAVIEEKDYAAWKATLEGLDLSKRLAAVVGELFEELPRDKSGKPAEVAVVIDKVVDEGIPGGPRAIWLRDHMARALLVHRGIRTIEAPKAWAGDGVPTGAGAVLFANIVTRREGQRTMLEVLWKARLPMKASFWDKPASGVLVLEAVAPPRAGPPAPELPKEPTLSVRIDAASGGALCVGQTTQLYLRSTEDRYVQVYDLYGNDKALLLFPNEDHPDGRVRANQTLPIGGPGGFAAVPVEGAELERFVVLGAPTRDALGPLKAFRGTCRVRARDLALLTDPKRLSPAVVRAGDGFRLVRGEVCKGVAAPAAAEIEALERDLRQLRECK